jgi:Tfp pilus assembly protein PilN
MIRINLLPAEYESAPTQISPAIPLVAAAILPLIPIVIIQLGLMNKKRQLQAEKASINSELDRYQPIIAQVEALEKAKNELNSRKGVIQQLETERLRYPQFMDDFLKLLPSNLWLTNLTTALQPANNTMSVNLDVTALDNYAIADLIANLETSQIFSDVDLGTIQTTQSATGGQSLSFHLTTVYRKVGALPDAAKKP